MMMSNYTTAGVTGQANGARNFIFNFKWQAALALTLLLVGCGKGEKQGAGMHGEMPPAEVTVTEVQTESVPMMTELPGRIDAVRVAQVRARVPGILLKQSFKEGSEVKAGDVLFEIDAAPLQALYDSVKAEQAKAVANNKQAQAKMERFKVLVGINAVSKQEYDDAISTSLQGEADVLAAKAALETAALNLGYTKVTAPISGRIGRAKVTEGALVGQNEATELAVIQQLDPIYFDFTQSSTEVLHMRRALDSGKLKSSGAGAAKVTLLLEDGTVYQHEGKLLFSDITVDPTTGMISLRAEFPNPDKLLLPGMFARGRIEQAVDEKALTLPQRSVARGPSGTSSVLIVGADNKVEARTIKADVAFGDKWIITSGVKAGERVIVEGVQKTHPGAVVIPVPFGATNAPASTNAPTAATNAPATAHGK